MIRNIRPSSDFVSRKALAAGSGALTPAASALPLMGFPPRELDEIDRELKGVTDRIVEMIGELSQ